MQGPDPSLAYRPDLEKCENKEKEDYRNFQVIRTFNQAEKNEFIFASIYE